MHLGYFETSEVPREKKIYNEAEQTLLQKILIKKQIMMTFVNFFELISMSMRILKLTSST